MEKNTYFVEREIKVRGKIEELKKNLPSFCSDYAVSELNNGNSPLTVYNYLTDLSVFFEYLKENYEEVNLETLESLLPLDIMKFLDFQRLGRGRELKGKIVESRSGDKALARKLSSIKSLYRFLFNNDKIKTNMTTKIPSPKIQSQDNVIKRLEFEEAQELLVAPDNKQAFNQRQAKYLENTAERDRAIISFFLATGVRVSELVGLNTNDVDLERRYFDITRKGGKIERLYFAEDLASILNEWLKKRETLNLPKNEDAFFISLQKRRMTVQAVEKMIGKYGYSVLGKKLSPHKLRATYGTELYKATGDIYKVATALGHSSVDTTRKHYADFDEQRKKDIAGIIRVGS